MIAAFPCSCPRGSVVGPPGILVAASRSYYAAAIVVTGAIAIDVALAHPPACHQCGAVHRLEEDSGARRLRSVATRSRPAASWRHSPRCRARASRVFGGQRRCLRRLIDDAVCRSHGAGGSGTAFPENVAGVPLVPWCSRCAVAGGVRCVARAVPLRLRLRRVCRWPGRAERQRSGLV
jgi:hypothetical protein